MGMEQGNTNSAYTVGTLAKMAGISVRTLQYYDRYGLLACAHGEGGRRLYGRSDLIRLQQILFLKSYGFSLAQIRDRVIDVGTGPLLSELLTAQKEVVACQIARLQEMSAGLEKIIGDLQSCETVGADTFVAIVELAKLNAPIPFVERYFSKDQLDRLATDIKAKERQDQSRRLFGEMLRLYKSGADPHGEEGQRLAEQLWKLATELSGGDGEMMRNFISMGIDAKNWPDGARELSDAISAFMSVATMTYIENHQIPLNNFADLLK
jgi:MerR family transcriptional regulator, thiopeptide resistance regulator